MTMADRIVVMDAGRIAQVGTPEEVYHRPDSPFVATFMGADNMIALDDRAQRALRARRSAAGAHHAATPGDAPPAATGPAVAYFRDDVARLDATRCIGADGRDRRCPGRITQRAYPGGHYRYAVGRAAAQFTRRRTSRIRGRDAVGLCLPLDALHMFPRSEAHTPTREEAHERILIAGLGRWHSLAWSARRRARRPSMSPPPATRTWSTTSSDYLGPMFEKKHPGVKVVAVGTGPGDAGSQKINEKLDAQKKAGADAWDFDVIVVHQKMAGQMVGERLLAKYRGQDRDRQAGHARDGRERARRRRRPAIVMPMFHSQTALAYNPDLVKDACPSSYAELVEWAKKNPKKFGYNGIKGGMSGVAFVAGWVYGLRRRRRQAEKGPYDAATKASWDKALADLKEFNKNVIITPGNAGTLDMLNRGEIAIGPVWVDMFYTWQADGKLPPNMKLKLDRARHAGPADVLRHSGQGGEQRSWPRNSSRSPPAPRSRPKASSSASTGIRASTPRTSKASSTRRPGTSCSPTSRRTTLASKGKPFPIAPYFNDILEAYEKKVAN